MIGVKIYQDCPILSVYPTNLPSTQLPIANWIHRARPKVSPTLVKPCHYWANRPQSSSLLLHELVWNLACLARMASPILRVRTCDLRLRRIRGCWKVIIFQWLTRLNRDCVINCAMHKCCYIGIKNPHYSLWGLLSVFVTLGPVELGRGCLTLFLNVSMKHWV